jgi:hypothetical protein
MKKKTILIALAAMLAVTLAAIPALAQNEQPADEPSAVCPLHDRESMTSQDMEQWMDSPAHDEWMESADHDRMDSAMGNMDRMMNEHRVEIGNMMGAGNMMGSSG